MAIICAQCGTSNRDGARFCASCRAPLPQPALVQMVDADRSIGFPVISTVVGIICLIYLVNPTAGVLELLPDNLPVIGNLDEVAAVTGLLSALASIGFIEWQGGRLRFPGWAGVRARWRRP